MRIFRRLRAWLALPGRLVAVGLLTLHLLLLGAAIGLATGADLNPSPSTHSGSSACQAVLGDDDLVHLALRDPDHALAQLGRWHACDPTTRQRAKQALPKDAVLIAVLAAALGLAVVRCWRRIRWRLAAYIAGALAAAYVSADITENVLLARLLRSAPQTSAALPWFAAIKFGAFFGALPIFLVSLCLVIGQVKTPRSHQRARVRRQAVKGFVRRWWDRIRHPRGHAEQPPEAPEATPSLGICCSGGGIRSAAFSLGALQALDEYRVPATAAKTELGRAEWLSAVSGGSYLAAAWTSARSGNPKAWARLSAEEDHLRRHSSYLGEGIAGKIWALVRFLLGFALNLGLVALALMFVFLPYGWIVDAGQHARPPQGGSSLDLPAGACLEVPDGRHLIAVPGTTLRLSSGSAIPLDANAPVQISTPKPEARADEADDEDESTTAPTTTTTAPAAAHESAVATCPAQLGTSTPAEGLRAAARGRRLEKGTRVLLQVESRLLVNGRNVAACLVSSVEQKASCSESQAEIYQVPSGSRLLSAPTAIATLAGSGIVNGEHHVVRACGTHPCQSSGPPKWLGTAVWILTGLTLLIGFAHVVVRPYPTTSRWVQLTLRALGGLAVAVIGLVYVMPYLIVWAENGRWWLEDEFRFKLPALGVLTVGGALLSQIGAFTGTNETPGTSAIPSFLKKVGARLRPLLLRLAGAVIGPLLVLIAAILLGSFAAQRGWSGGQLGLWLGAFGLFACLLAGGDLNEWSLHPFYRDRLRSGFVADAAVGDGVDTPLGELPTGNPKLIICAAANVADSHLTAPGRPVVPWVFTRDGIGSEAIGRALGPSGVVPPGSFTDRLAPLTSLWTAVAVSGAAFSPAMGKMTKPERFLFALGNLRLGVWYPNPACLSANPGWYTTHHPRPWYLAKEALGLHRVDDPWIYVTDGGHYENLGLVELLRRGCREIYCFDGSGDSTSTFGTLAEAMRLARAELDVEIDIEPTKALKADKDGISKLGAWAGTLRYRDESIPSGWIVIAKLEVPERAPFDIVDLARTLPSFPSTPTGDQLYTDQKFEAYRALGDYLGEQAAQLGTDIRGRIIGGTTVAQAVKAANDATYAALGDGEDDGDDGG
jgi:hypothetical protein